MSPLLLGAVLGGAAMFLFDPDKGKRRRALIRDQAIKAQSNVRDLVDAGTQDLKNRGTAAIGRTRSMITQRISGKPPTDQVLAERVRSKMGRYVAHPGAIEVTAAGGEVTLSGSILSHEHDELIEGISTVPGVTDIRDKLGVYETAEGISELQGDGKQAGRRPADWAPGTRLVSGAGGTALTLYALTRHSKLAGFVAFASGVALIARTITNRPLLSGMKPQNGDAAGDQADAALEGSRAHAANEESV